MTRLEQLRVEAHLNQTQLAEKTGVSVWNIRSIERGKTLKPSPGVAGPLADFFGIPVVEFIRTCGETAPEAA